MEIEKLNQVPKFKANPINPEVGLLAIYNALVDNYGRVLDFV